MQTARFTGQMVYGPSFQFMIPLAKATVPLIFRKQVVRIIAAIVMGAFAV